jgi:hypothetical protein
MVIERDKTEDSSRAAHTLLTLVACRKICGSATVA